MGRSEAIGMRNAWVLDLQSQPPIVVAHVASETDEMHRKCLGVLATTFPEPHFTIVQEVGVDV